MGLDSLVEQEKFFRTPAAKALIIEAKRRIAAEAKALLQTRVKMHPVFEGVVGPGLGSHPNAKTVGLHKNEGRGQKRGRHSEENAYGAKYNQYL